MKIENRRFKLVTWRWDRRINLGWYPGNRFVRGSILGHGFWLWYGNRRQS